MEVLGTKLGGLVPLVGAGESFWFPQQGSTYAANVDRLFYFILGVSFFFFALIIGLMLLFVFKYRRRPGQAPQASPSHNNWLEVAWTGVAAILVAIIFAWGFLGYLDMRQPPANSYEIRVLAKRWVWAFQYPNGHVDSDLHVPVDRPIRLVMSSDDVIHSLFIPTFRLKMDVVPGRYSTTWFQATEPGEDNLFCAEYCGREHSGMVAKVVVHPSGEFESWLTEAANFLKRMTPVEGGKLLYQRRGCAQCHSVDGSARVGPSLHGSFGTEQALTDGSQAKIDENYLRESILQPQAKVRAGYKPVMPSYQGQLKNEEIDALIAYIKSLNEDKK